MKSQSILTTSILTLAALTLVVCPATAATTAYTAGDLFVGFRKTGATSDYLVDLGQVSQFRDATSGFTLSIAGINTDLTSLFGAGWKTDPTVFWGLVATSGVTAAGGDAANVLYASKPQDPFGTIGTAYLRDSSSSQGNVRSAISTLGTTYGLQGSTANNPVGIVQSSSDSASWAAFNPGGGLSFSYFDGLEGNFGNGTAGTTLDLFRMAPQTPATGVPGSYEGSFSIDNAGMLNFSIPEPSSALLIGLGAGLLGLRRRRATAA
ncbi:MAG: sorting protein [Chthoniobacteraceae bacterium]|nr:sorting protein [Chthoniobacteraceae bacterium]